MDCAQQPDFYGLNEFLYKETDSEYEYEGEIYRSMRSGENSNYFVLDLK